jgi:hypothetical protein
MKVKIWVLCTVLADENAPAMPAVFASEMEAWAKYDEVIRAEWDSMMDPNGDGLYPGDPDAAQHRIRQAHGAEWRPLGADVPRRRNLGGEIAYLAHRTSRVPKPAQPRAIGQLARGRVC